MDEFEGKVIMSLADYDDMKSHIDELEKDVDRMYDERSKICEEKSVRQIIRHLDEDGDLIVDELIGFDDVFDEINKEHDNLVIKQEKKIKSLNEMIAKKDVEIIKLKKELDSLRKDFDAYKKRSIWKMVFNKG